MQRFKAAMSRKILKWVRHKDTDSTKEGCIFPSKKPKQNSLASVIDAMTTVSWLLMDLAFVGSTQKPFDLEAEFEESRNLNLLVKSGALRCEDRDLTFNKYGNNHCSFITCRVPTVNVKLHHLLKSEFPCSIRLPQLQPRLPSRIPGLKFEAHFVSWMGCFVVP